MFESKATREEAIAIPTRIAKKLSLRDGMVNMTVMQSAV